MAILILAIAAGGILQGLAFTSAALGSARVQTIATNLAASVLEGVQSTEYVELGTVGGDIAGEIVPDRTETVDGIVFRIQTAVEVVDQPTLGQAAGGANYKRVTVRVTPQVPGARSSRSPPSSRHRWRAPAPDRPTSPSPCVTPTTTGRSPGRRSR